MFAYQYRIGYQLDIGLETVFAKSIRNHRQMAIKSILLFDRYTIDITSLTSQNTQLSYLTPMKRRAYGTNNNLVNRSIDIHKVPTEETYYMGIIRDKDDSNYKPALIP